MVKQGDIIRLNFSPTTGREQSGYRPAVIVSNDFAIARTNVVYVAPITNSMRPFPLHIALDDGTKTKGTILCEQVKAADLNVRQFTFIEHLPGDLLGRVLNCVTSCF